MAPRPCRTCRSTCRRLGADFYAFSGHKMLAPLGSGALWARRELLEAMPPFLAGGEMIREVHLRRSDFNDIPWKFEAGTPAVAAAIGLGVAADYLRELGMERVAAHEQELVAYALETLPAKVAEIELYGPMDPDLRGGVVPFNLPGIHPHDVAQVLDRSGIAVRAGHHCTMPLHERLDLAATARASFNVYSTTRRHRRPGDRADRGPARLQRLTAYTHRPMDDLYRDYILEHSRRPHNFGVIEDAERDLRGQRTPVRRPDHADARREGRRSSTESGSPAAAAPSARRARRC